MNVIKVPHKFGITSKVLYADATCLVEVIKTSFDS
jgi:hypothetical protein